MRMIVSVSAGLAMVATCAWFWSQNAAAQPAAKVEPPPYRLGISDMMTAFIQPRHTKLWLAGSAQNWDYAEYERHNLAGAFERLVTSEPTTQGQDVAPLVAAFVTPPLAALQTAIAAKDQTAFATAYDALTVSCNQCHQATGHGVVVLQTPHQGAFSDQVFTPSAN